MQTDLWLCLSSDEQDDLDSETVTLLTNDQLSELEPGCFFYYRKDGTKRDIDQPCDTTQLFMVCVPSDYTEINHHDKDRIPVEEHVSVIEIASGEIYHEHHREWVHVVETVSLRVFVK